MRIRYSFQDAITPQELFRLSASVGFAEHRSIEANRKAIAGSSFIATARHGKKLIGIIRLITDGGYVIHVADTAVAPEYQRQGIGTKLLKMAIKYARKIKVGTGKNLGEFSLFANTGAVEFYRHSDFSICPNGMILTDDPIRTVFEGEFQKKWIKRHKAAASPVVKP
jgi:GNAT superfamily N-acetyltransferase